MENDIIDVELDDDSYSAVNRLLEIARKKTFATIDDILQVFPEAEQNVDQLEEAFSALQNVGIPYIEDPTEEDEVGVDELDLLADDLEIAPNLYQDDLANIDTDDTIGLYLKEVSRVPLLSADEEVDLAQAG